MDETEWAEMEKSWREVREFARDYAFSPFTSFATGYRMGMDFARGGDHNDS